MRANVTRRGSPLKKKSWEKNPHRHRLFREKSLIDYLCGKGEILACRSHPAFFLALTTREEGVSWRKKQSPERHGGKYASLGQVKQKGTGGFLKGGRSLLGEGGGKSHYKPQKKTPNFLQYEEGRTESLKKVLFGFWLKGKRKKIFSRPKPEKETAWHRRKTGDTRVNGHRQFGGKRPFG